VRIGGELPGVGGNQWVGQWWQIEVAEGMNTITK
jgi:hypothetical protein